MAEILLSNVSLEFPIYNANSRSIKKRFLRFSTGGKVLSDANQKVVVRALDNVNLHIQHGDRIALVGHNGAGKSTILRLLAGIYETEFGKVKIEGRISPLLDIASGVETESTGYENIYIRGVLYGLNKKQIAERTEEIAEFTGLGDYLSMPIRTYSSGMLVRLCFAIATSIEPEILLIDEVFGAGDMAFMEKAQQRMISLLNKSSIFLLASHSNALVKEFCNKAIWMDTGRIRQIGPVDEIIEQYEESLA